MGRRLQFYHGTNVDLEVGDHVLPPSVSGAVTAHRRRDSNHFQNGLVSATTNERTAWNFADRAAHFTSRGYGRVSMGQRDPAPGGTGRARVYRVEPVGERQLGVENRHHPEYEGPDTQEHVAPAWRVTERLDIEPPSDGLHFAGGPGLGRARYVPNRRL